MLGALLAVASSARCNYIIEVSSHLPPATGGLMLWHCRPPPHIIDQVARQAGGRHTFTHSKQCTHVHAPLLLADRTASSWPQLPHAGSPAHFQPKHARPHYRLLQPAPACGPAALFRAITPQWPTPAWRWATIASSLAARWASMPGQRCLGDASQSLQCAVWRCALRARRPAAAGQTWPFGGQQGNLCAGQHECRPAPAP